jgi:hypothetical protein
LLPAFIIGKAKVADILNMQDRRVNPRMLCADLVKIEWLDKSGAAHTAVANLEDISSSGACLQMEEDVPLQIVVKITHEKGTFEGKVRYCLFKDIGYFLGVEFEPGQRWSAKNFKPMHLLDPRRLSGLKDDGAGSDQGLIAAS